VFLCSALYVSDWRLTMTCARLYRNGVVDTIRFEGSYEITPLYQREVDALRGWSWKGTVVLATLAGILWQLWHASSSGWPDAYEIVLGALVLLQLVVHIRHLRNLHLFRSIGSRGIRGSIEYPRDMMLFASSNEILAFSVLFAVIFAVSGSLFVLGGVFSCLVVSAQHRILARRHVAAARPDDAAPHSQP
jgi:hypothetical protein